MTITSHPHGSKQCDACKAWTDPTLTINTGDGDQTACDACRRFYEAKGMTSLQAIEQAISDATFDRKGAVKRRDKMIIKIRRDVGQNKREGEQLLAFDLELGEAAQEKREARRVAA